MFQILFTSLLAEHSLFCWKFNLIGKANFLKEKVINLVYNGLRWSGHIKYSKEKEEWL